MYIRHVHFYSVHHDERIHNSVCVCERELRGGRECCEGGEESSVLDYSVYT